MLTFYFTAKYSTNVLANVANYLINVVRILHTGLFLYCYAISGLNSLFSFSFLSFSVALSIEIERFENDFEYLTDLGFVYSSRTYFSGPRNTQK